MQIIEKYLPQSSGAGRMYCRIWSVDRPRAALQIAHGMAEHCARYDEFAAFLNEHGIAVFANDHAGHGNSKDPGGYGVFAAKEGHLHAIADMKRLGDEICAQYPGAPVFLLGHSMGSIMARVYITKYGGLAGCIISSTVGVNPLVGVGIALSSVQTAVMGHAAPARLLQKLQMGGANKTYENPVNEFAWLSRDEAVSRAYYDDERCGFPLSAGAYHDMLVWTKSVSGAEWAKRVPQGLPILQIAGDDDPVGDYGKGPRLVHQWLLDAGCEAELRLYVKGRHEMLNETNRREVFGDVLDFIERNIQGIGDSEKTGII